MIFADFSCAINLIYFAYSLNVIFSRRHYRCFLDKLRNILDTKSHLKCLGGHSLLPTDFVKPTNISSDLYYPYFSIRFVATYCFDCNFLYVLLGHTPSSETLAYELFGLLIEKSLCGSYPYHLSSFGHLQKGSLSMHVNIESEKYTMFFIDHNFCNIIGDLRRHLHHQWASEA